MNALGICSYTNIVYEGPTASHGLRVTPRPLLLPLRFLGADGVRGIDNVDQFAPEIFREESFDPVSKVRRGRIYSRRLQTAAQSLWRVQDPLRSDLPVVHWGHGQAQEITLINYTAEPLLELRKPENRRHPPKVLLGWEEHATLWQIVAIEAPVGGGPMLTLKALYSLGDLPELVESGIPERIRKRVVEQWDKLDGTVNRLGAVEVIDRCRDFLSVVFGELSGEPHRDLSDAVNRYVSGRKGEDVHSSAGRIVARLHSRGKPNEQEGKGLRPPTDGDAQLAVRCVGIILIDLGWAR